MKKILSTVFGLIFLLSVNSNAEEKLTIEKQLVGIVGLYQVLSKPKLGN